MRGLLVATTALLAILVGVLTGCAGPAGPDHEESTSPAHTPTASPSAPTSATSDTGDLVVCASIAPLVARMNGAFNTLTAGASQQRRTQVAGSFERTHRQIRTIVERAGLTRPDQVRDRALAVAQESAKVARLLRSGSAVGNGGLQTAQRQLATACAK
ncbi:MAG TPA: hypothetical protein VHC49_01465 [Mycobacteriales bacterium]|nr:hypothetical protein [Mycobacteriales bacterium]